MGARVLLAVAVITGTFGVTVASAADAWAQPGWSSPTPVDLNTGGDVSSVSCAQTSNFCAVVDNDGNTFTYDGTSWSAPESIDSGSNGLDAVTA